MKRSACLAAIGLLICGPVHADSYRFRHQYVGEARDPERGTLLYTEHHLLHSMSSREDPADAQPRHRLVLYRCADGRLFARKRVEYRPAAAAPAFELEDGRFGYVEGVRHVGDEAEVYFRPDARAAPRLARVAHTPALVIDAGFDQFVRAHWEALQRGETLRVDFLVPSRLETLGFKLRRVGAASLADAPASVFRLSLAGLLGWFASDIEVSYRDADRRLMRFEGLTNIRADREDNLVARIDFPPAREQRGVEGSAWNAALAEPLTDCVPGQ